MLKRGSMKKKNQDADAPPSPSPPIPETLVGGEAGTPSPSQASRKKTGGTKRPSVFGSLFSKASRTPNDDQTKASMPSPLLGDPEPRTEVHTVRDPSDFESVSGPPSPKRDASHESPPLIPARKASKDEELPSPSKQSGSPSLFEVSDRKEPSRGGKPPIRGQGSKKELLGPLALSQTRQEGSRSESRANGSRADTDLSRKDGSRAGVVPNFAKPSPIPRHIMSARLPALTLGENDNQSVNSFLSAQQLLESRPRAESDPCPLYGSTLEDDFGFDDDLKKVEGEKGPRQEEEDDDLLLNRRSSFQKPRAPSFNTETRTWEGRRSLQLSVNQKGDVGGTVHVSAATLDRLVEYVVSSNEFMEASQVSGFLLTYHSYVNSQGLLSALASRYDVSTSNKDQVARIRTLYVLQRWIEEHWYDFESDDILLMGVVQFALSRLKEFPEDEDHKHDPCYSLLKKLATVQQLAQSKMQKRALEGQGLVSIAHEDEDDLKAAAIGEEVMMKEHRSIAPRLLKHQSRLLIKLEKAPPLEVPRDFASVWHAKLEGKPTHLVLSNSLVSKVELARQMTVLEHNMYKKIPPTELIAQATKQMAKPPEHVRAMIGHFNGVSKFVALTICSFVELTPRVYMLRKWIKIGRECLRLNNYNAVFEIMAGIHSVAVLRLHKTHGSLNVKTKTILGKLEEVTSRKNNYGTYRSLLAQNTVPIQPAVPFIGATLTDLSFLDSGHRNVVENGEGDSLINFTKHRRVAQVIGTIKKFQDHPYLLDTSPEISAFLQVETAKAASMSDKDIYALSLLCEAPTQTAGGQAQAAFFDFESPEPGPVGGHKREESKAKNHRKEDSKATFLFKMKG